MKKIIALATLATLILSSCTKETEGLIKDPNLMEFDAELVYTRATATEFEAGDVIGVYVSQYEDNKPTPLQVSGNYASNISSVYNGEKWVNSIPIYWSEGKFDVYAYYPHSKPLSVDEYVFSVQLDQSKEETEEALSGYEASDFMWAKATGISQVDAVPLRFSHKMSKLVVNLIKGEYFSGEIPEDAIVRVHSTVPGAVIDLATGSVARDGYQSAKSITAKKISNGVYSAIVVPQRLENKLPLIEVLSNGVSYLIESKFVFRSGTQHTINLTLNNNPDKVRIEIGGEIEGDWN